MFCKTGPIAIIGPLPFELRAKGSIKRSACSAIVFSMFGQRISPLVEFNCVPNKPGINMTGFLGTKFSRIGKDPVCKKEPLPSIPAK